MRKIINRRTNKIYEIMARKKSLSDLHYQWVRIRDGINRRYGSYDREFGMHNVPKKGEGKRIYDRASSAYSRTRNIVENNLRRKGLARKEYVGYSYDTNAKVNSIKAKGAVSG